MFDMNEKTKDTKFSLACKLSKKEEGKK